MLQLVPPISHLIHPRRPSVYLSLLTPSILCLDDFIKSHTTAQKILRGFRKLYRRSSMTRPGWEWRNNGLSKGEVGETAVADQRNLTANASIADMAAEMESDRRESVRKLAQAHDVSARTVHAALRITWSSQRSRPRWATKRFSLRWRRSDSGRARRPKRWRPRFFDSFRQHYHSLRGGRGWRVSWPASFSLRRPPGSAEMGVREIARRRTSPRRSGGNKSAAWSAWRSPATILRKSKNRK
jgi:hypothetical protein